VAARSEEGRVEVDGGGMLQGRQSCDRRRQHDNDQELEEEGASQILT
jgi:hypothetical protein